MNLVITKIKTLCFAILVIILPAVSIVAFNTTVSAQDRPTNATDCIAAGGQWKLADPETNTYACTIINKGATDESGGRVENPALTKPQSVHNDCNDAEINEENCGIIRYLVILIQALAVLVGIVVTASIIYGGIQYSTAGNDPQKVSAAKNRIRNAIIALVFFLFMYGLLNWLVPGGVLQ